MIMKVINTNLRYDYDHLNKAIFLDRDGTINVDKEYVYKVEDFKFITGAIEALKILQDAGYLLIIITNQSGIARGYYKVEDFKRLNSWMLEQLKVYGIVISGVYYCPHHTEGLVAKYKKKCNCRKPETGMFERAINDFNIDVSQSYVIGDNLRDLCICEKGHVKGILIGEKNIEKLKYVIVENLLSAAKLIVINNRKI